MGKTMTIRTDERVLGETSDDAQQLRAENERLREALEGVLMILGNPNGYCSDDRTEVAQAVAEVERALGRRAQPDWRKRKAAASSR